MTKSIKIATNHDKSSKNLQGIALDDTNYEKLEKVKT